MLTTDVYPELSSKFAMKIGKRATLVELDENGWSGFAIDSGLSFPIIRRRIEEISERVTTRARTTAETPLENGLDQDALENFADLTRERATRCAMTLVG